MTLSMTAREMREAGACYDLATIEGLWDGRESITALDILDLDIPDKDKLWGVLRESLIPAGGLRELACRFAEMALAGEVKANRTPDARSYESIRVARAFANGSATPEHLAAAYDAAADAAYDAANGAANGAAYAAARAAV